MLKIKRTTQQILEDAQRALDTAELGYESFKKQSKNRLSGLMNVAVFGVSVTCVLQNLRSVQPEFDKWYEPYKLQMAADPLMKYFWNLRSEILKEGKLQLGSHAVLNLNVSPSTSFDRIPPPPPNVKVKSFFMGDRLGCSGYEIEQADGSINKYYVKVPKVILKTSLHFPDSPKTHLGHCLSDYSVENLSRLYLDYLKKMVDDAKARFGKKVNT